MTKSLSQANIIVKIDLAVLLILSHLLGIVSGKIADVLFVLAVLVLIYYILRILFTWMFRD